MFRLIFISMQKLVLILLFLGFIISPISFAEDSCKYCDFAQIYVGTDKYESFNRKMFDFNRKLNKYLARPVQILWSSIIPKYGMDRLQSVYHNIEYPKRLVSCLIQKDFEGVKSETKRFITNTTIGLGGLYNPAERLFKLKPVSENMDQALCKCKIKSGPYFVMPVLSFCSPRSLLGRLLEAALDPCIYIATPLTSFIKFAFVVNKASYTQPMVKMIESTYADPYDIAKKFYGMENYIKTKDLDRKDLLVTDAKLLEEKVIANVDNSESLRNIAEQISLIQDEESVLAGMEELAAGSETGAACDLTPDIVLTDFKAQSPVVDSMRTALFDVPKIHNSFWNELSIWNRSFAKRVKSDNVSITSNREDYKFRYILQRDKKSPLAILYPSIGEGITSHHSVVFAKLFYDLGYSVIILGSHFQWEFVKSMPEQYCPGLPLRDSENLQKLTYKIIQKLEKEKDYSFSKKVLVGTSFGAMATLFVGDKESKNPMIGIDKYIAISPPIELVYAIKQVDKNSEPLLNTDDEESKHKTATTAAKIIQILNQKKEPDFKFSHMPFTEDEGKLIVSFLMRQKLSDLVLTIEGVNVNQKNNIYSTINNMSYKDYAEKYLLSDSGGTLDDLRYDTSLYLISDFLKTSKDYKIYHSLDDFFITKEQLEKIKLYSPSQVICLNNGSHLGFLYRQEFIDSFKKIISGVINDKATKG